VKLDDTICYCFHVTRRKLSAYQGLLGFMRGGPT